MKSLSLIILTYNSEKDIYDCLKSVYLYNDIGDDLEIIVVDNNSKNFAVMQNRLHILYPNVLVINNLQNGGYGQGNNVGIKASTAPIVAIMNPDVRLIMPVFNEFILTLQNPNSVMCSGKQYQSQQKVAESYCYGFTSHAILRSFGQAICRKLNIYDYHRMWLQGAFFAIKKEEFEHIGLFDEHIFMYSEEFDIFIRLRKSYPQKKIAYLSHIHYLHLAGGRPNKDIAKRLSNAISSELYLCQKYNFSVKQYVINELRTMQYRQFICAILHPNLLPLVKEFNNIKKKVLLESTKDIY